MYAFTKLILQPRLEYVTAWREESIRVYSEFIFISNGRFGLMQRLMTCTRDSILNLFI